MSLASPEVLKKRGWEQPVDDSLVDVPDGWHRGDVVHTGGGIYCRIWRTVEKIPASPKEDDLTVYFDVGYDSNFMGVSLERYEYNPEVENWEFAGTVEHREAAEQSDDACAALAVDLMQSVDPIKDS